MLCCAVLCCAVLCCAGLCFAALCCGEGAFTRRQWLGCLPTGAGKRLCVLCACCVLVCCCIAGPVHTCTWLALFFPRLHAVTHRLIGPLHRACRAAPSMLFVWCRTAWCCAMHCTVCALLHCSFGQRAVGSGTPATHRHTACRLWAVELLLCTAALPGGCGQWNSCNTLPLCLGALGSATPATHCLTACGQWAVQLLQLPHRVVAVGSAAPATHCLTAWGQWPMGLLQRTASLPGGSWQWNSCNTLPR